MSKFFFHDKAFVFRKPQEEIITFSSTLNDARIAIYFTNKVNELISLDRSPFGSFIIEGEAEIGVLSKLLQEVFDYAQMNNLQTITVRCFPEIYNPKNSVKIHETFYTLNFNLKYKDITQAIHINSQPPAFNRNRKRKLNLCFNNEFSFRELSVANLSTAYALIVESRNNKDYPVTMSFEDLEHMFHLFPQHYLLFGVFDKGMLIATAVCIVVNTRILYCFYIGDSISYRHFSPVTLLVYEIYHYSFQYKFELLDLGISTDKGVLNAGLYNFKKSLGSTGYQKLTFEKKL